MDSVLLMEEGRSALWTIHVILQNSLEDSQGLKTSPLVPLSFLSSFLEIHTHKHTQNDFMCVDPSMSCYKITLTVQ